MVHVHLCPCLPREVGSKADGNVSINTLTGHNILTNTPRCSHKLAIMKDEVVADNAKRTLTIINMLIASVNTVAAISLALHSR